MLLQWADPLPLVQERGSKWGHHSQPPVDSALQAGPRMWEMLQLPVHQVGPSTTTARRTANLRGGRSQWVILISITTSTKCARSIFPKWDPGQRIYGRIQCPLGHLMGHSPSPISMALEENQTEEAPPANPTHPHHLSLPAPRSDCCCILQIQNCLQHYQSCWTLWTLNTLKIKWLLVAY